MLGVKYMTSDNILLVAAESVHMNIMIFCLILKNPFSTSNALICLKIPEFKLNMTEAINTLYGLALISKNVSFLKKLSNPPVVGVSVVDVRRTKICNGI